LRQLESHIVPGDLPQNQITIGAGEPGVGNAPHEYDVNYGGRILSIRFQEGGIKEVGLNGVTNEALLAIVEDRLKGFQSGKFVCRENAVALTHIQEALMWLQRRTVDRVRRGVEGQVKP